MTSPRTHAFGEQGRSFLDRVIAWVRLRHVTRFIQTGATLLDLGCGYHGQLLIELSPKLAKGVGIDLSVDPHGSQGKIKLLSGRVDTRLPFPDKTFDVVTALAIIEHVEDPSTMLDEMRRVTKPGGRILLTTPSQRGKMPLELMARLRLISHLEIADHKRYYTAESLRAALCSAGMTHVRVRAFGILFLNLFAEGCV